MEGKMRCCWYCRENSTTEGTEYLLHKDKVGARVLVPRCARCTGTHKKALSSYFVSAAVALVALVGVFAASQDGTPSGSGLRIGAALGMLAVLGGLGVYKLVLKRAGVPGPRAGLKHPAIQKCLDEGFALGPAR